MLHYLLIVNKDGVVQFSHYFVEATEARGRAASEARAAARCLASERETCHFLEDGDRTLVFRWFGPCLFVASSGHEENELMAYEFLGLYVGALHRYFGRFSERHVLLAADRLHMVLEEMVVGGELVESSVRNALSPIQMLDSVAFR